LAQTQNPLPARRSQGEPPRLAPRICLLKGCDRSFSPNHYLDRYCGEDCRDAARRWRIARANLKYRASEHGRKTRQAQAVRNRVRRKERKAAEAQRHADTEQGPSGHAGQPREGYHKDQSEENSCCDRPGCYQRFTPPPRSPLQRFCSLDCCNALRCVRLRERRWIRWLAAGPQRTRGRPP
jgi:hypothetical protein